MKRLIAIALILCALPLSAQWTETTSGQQAGSGIGVGGLVGATVPSAATISLTEFMTSVSGAAVISNITGLVSGRIYVVVPAAGSTWSMTTGGNIAQAVTPTALEPIVLVMHGTTVRVMPSGGTLDARYAETATANTFAALITAAGGVTVPDNTFTIQDNVTPTKQVQFQASSITAANTRTITVPDSNTTLPVFAQPITFAGFTAARTLTFSDASQTVARRDAGQTFAGANTFSALTEFTLGITERGRSDEVGEWIAVAHNGANYTASAGNWTVDLADHISVKYMLIGKTMVLSFRLFSTDVSATPAALRMAIPGGFTVAATTDIPMWYSSAGAAFQNGLAQVSTGQTVVEFYRDPSAATNWGTTAADNTVIRGQITFEIQ